VNVVHAHATKQSEVLIPVLLYNYSRTLVPTISKAYIL